MRPFLGFVAILLLSAPAFADAALITRTQPLLVQDMDTYFGSTYNGGAAQSDGWLYVGGQGNEYDSLMRFNLSGLPLTATNAYIWLYSNAVFGSSLPTKMTLYRNTSQWHTNVVSWSQQPSSAIVGTLNAPAKNAWYYIDVTSLYNSWRGGNPINANYGIKLKPVSKINHFNLFRSSGNLSGGLPALDVYYTPQENDSIIKHKWPLSTPSYADRTEKHAFGENWATGATCTDSNGVTLPKLHNGTDFAAQAGISVYAAEDGVLKEVITREPWASNIVMEHTSPSGGKYTTVYWHVNPVTDVNSANYGRFYPKGMKVGTIATLSTGTHFHVGMRMGAYVAGVSGTGSLPQTTCGGYPAFPAGFINPNDPSNIIFN